MAFNIMDLFGPAATNRLLQPLPSAQGVPNFLMNPEAAAQPAPPLAPPIEVGPAPAVAGAPVDNMQTASIAAPAQQQALAASQPSASAQKPSFGQRYNDFWQSDRGQFLQDMFAGWAMGSTPAESIAMGARMASGSKKDRKNLNETVEWLKGKGMDEGQAKMIASNPKTLQEYLTQLITPQNSKGNLINAGGNLYNPETGQWITPPAGANGPADLGLNPQYGTDANGNPVLLQLSKDGKVVQSQMPDGVSLSKEPIKLDAGTHYVLLDPITRQAVGQVPKNNYQESFDSSLGSTDGKAQSEARFSLPTDIGEAEKTITELDALISHEGLSEIAGPLDQFRPSYSMSGKGRDALARFNQVKGRAFLQAFGVLKGGGQITEMEGAKAEQAMARMDRAQSEDEFKQALKDFRDAVSTGMNKMRQRAGVAAQPQAAPAQMNGGARQTSSGVTWSAE